MALDSNVSFVTHQHTRQFSSLILDYLSGHPQLRPFFEHDVSIQGFKDAMEDRKKFPTDRALIQEVFKENYKGSSLSLLQQQNLDSLADQDCFTICTAHQPNIFTGYLYFIYKTLHVITLAEQLSREIPGARFVPVFYIGSEDNDLDELSVVNLDGVKLRWETKQTGAVGRMKVDKGLLQLLDRIEGRVGVEPFGAGLMAMLRNSYEEGISIAEATFRLLNHLFSEYGLLVLQPDNGALKKTMTSVFRNDLTEHLPHALVDTTSRALDQQYKSQVHPREINLFYLTADGRYRITEKDNRYHLEGHALTFTREELLLELEQHPERFSPNVVLRGLYQETILPNIAFVGSGSEVAYWLELKALFNQFSVPFPVLVLRNSFVLVDESTRSGIAKTGLHAEDFFEPQSLLMDRLVRERTAHTLSLSTEIADMRALYQQLRDRAGAIDTTLQTHVTALETKALSRLETLEQKMLRAEKRKFEVVDRQLQKARAGLFPGGGFQERVDNFMLWYARFGPDFIMAIHAHSPGVTEGVGLVEITHLTGK